MNDSSNKPATRFDFRTFSILLLISVVPMLVGTWVLFSSYQEDYLEMMGTGFGDTAETAFSLVNTYLQNQIITTAGLTESPLLRSTVGAGNLDLKKNLEEVRRAIPKMEAAWPGLSREAPQAKAILDNPASQFLRRYTAVNQYYREILITDFFGRLVAATAKSPSYYFAHTDWWKETYGDGRRGSVYIGDVYYDSAARTYFMDIAQPFVDQDAGVTGVIKVVLDLQGIHSLVGSIQTGSDRSVVLIHAKGDVISAPGYSSLQQSTYPATLDILNAREKGRRFFVSTTLPQAIYGLTTRSFPQLYPHLNWIVVTTSRVDEVTGPLRQLRTYFIVLVLGVFLLVLIATLLLSRVESRPVLEEDPHLDRL
jgi:hypothetical protein